MITVLKPFRDAASGRVYQAGQEYAEQVKPVWLAALRSEGYLAQEAVDMAILVQEVERGMRQAVADDPTVDGSSTVAAIQAWLTAHGIPFTSRMSKADLLALVKESGD